MLLALLRLTFLEIAPRCIPVSILFLSSCADERPPTGGRKDSIPPKILYAEPDNKSTNFKGDKIKIRFQEYLQQTLDPKEIVISPPMDKKPKISVVGKNIVIKIKSKLRDSTTYTINFGDAVKDLNEGNVYKNFTYVFATGPMLDSASVSGSVNNIADPKTLDNIIISLYSSDSVDPIVRAKPLYFTKTDLTGKFKISNIKSGNYKIYGLKDVNLNYIYDQSDELVGYSDTILALTDSAKAKTTLSIFQSTTVRPKLQDALSISPGKILIYFNSPIKTLKLNSDITTKKDIIEVYEHKDSILYWLSNPYAKKITLGLVVNDSIIDTARIDLKALEKDSLNNNKKYSLGFEQQMTKADSTHKSVVIKPTLSPFKMLHFVFSRPVDSINQNKRLLIVNDTTSKMDTVAYILDEQIRKSIDVQYRQSEKTSYTLIVPDSSFRDIFGWWNKQFYYKWNSDVYENYGNIILSLKIEHPDRYYIFKILDQDNKPVGTFYYVGNPDRKITIKNVKAGSYHLQAIEDRNKNGEWDSGDFKNKVQPEKIINFSSSYELKGNWDLEIEVKL